MLTPQPAGTVYTAADAAGPAGASTASGVAWAAIFAGGVSASAISIILLILGTGIGLASVSPWAGAGVSPTTFTVLAAIWLIVVQWVSSAIGGYMAGRLRTKWNAVHTDEVFFRDTAHGFLAWALATLIAVGVISSMTTSGLGVGVKAASNAASGPMANRYYVDLLFRQNVNPDGTAATPASGSAAMVTGLSDQETRSEAATILAEGAANGGNIPAADNAYLAQLVSARTGMAPADAQARVNDVLSREQAAAVKAKQVANATRKATSGAMIYTFISMLIGAFIASVAGAIGGRLRDTY